MGCFPWLRSGVTQRRTYCHSTCSSTAATASENERQRGWRGGSNRGQIERLEGLEASRSGRLFFDLRDQWWQQCYRSSVSKKNIQASRKEKREEKEAPCGSSCCTTRRQRQNVKCTSIRTLSIHPVPYTATPNHLTLQILEQLSQDGPTSNRRKLGKEASLLRLFWQFCIFNRDK